MQIAVKSASSGVGTSPPSQEDQVTEQRLQLVFSSATTSIAKEVQHYLLTVDCLWWHERIATK